MKKAQVSTIQKLALAMVLLLLMFGIIYQVFKPAQQEFSERRLTNHWNLCTAKALEMGPERLAKMEKYVPDDYPDSCDICPFGNSNDDEDFDLIPTVCDENDDPRQGGKLETGCNKKKNLQWYDDLTQCLCRPGYEWNTKAPKDDQKCEKIPS